MSLPGTRSTRPRRALALVLLAAAALAAACNDPAESPKKPETNPEALRNMAPRTPGAGDTVTAGATPETEPNDVLEQAARLAWTGKALRVAGTLTGGSTDSDIFYVPALGPDTAATVLSVTLTPLDSGDVVLGIVTREHAAPVWFDSALAGDAEWLPNVALAPGGTWLVVSGRGDTDVGYLLDIEALGEQAATEAEPNDSELLAQPLAIGAVTTAYVNRAGDRDVFRIPPATPGAVGALNVTVTPPGGGRALDVTLRDDKATIWHALVTDGKPATFAGLRPSPTGYALVVELIGEMDKPRVYTVTVDQPQSTDAVELEPNDDWVRAQDLVPGSGPLRAAIGQLGDVDHFRVVFPAPTAAPGELAAPGTDRQVLTVQVEPADARLDPKLEVRLVEAGLGFPAASGRAGELEAVCNVAVSGQNTVEIQVAAAELPPDAALPLDYTLHVATRPAVGEEIEPNDRHPQASAVALGEAIAGFVHPGTDRDVYAFEVPANAHDPAARATTTLHLAEGYKANLALELYDGQFAAVSTGDRTGFGESEALVSQLPAGRYYAVVRSNGLASCDKPYRLTVSLDEAYLERLRTGTISPLDSAAPGTVLPVPDAAEPSAGQGDRPDPTAPGGTGPGVPADPDGDDDDGAPPPDRIDDDDLGF